MSELPGMRDESDLRGGETDCAEDLLIVRKLKEENAVLKEENERLKARVAELAAPDVQGEPVAEMSNDKMRDEFDSWIERQGMSTMKDGETYYHRVTHVAWQAWKASRAAPDTAVQVEPVAVLLIDEPEYTKQGWEPGDWDIEPNATTIEAFAKLAKPGAYQLYLAQQPTEQKPAPDVSALVEALERLVTDVERGIHVEFGGTPWLKEKMAEIDYARAALAAHRKGAQP